ncbi:choice-of-anchor A family protein [bacterium]|nr:choice-of-anchor A family protein [bacterium]
MKCFVCLKKARLFFCALAFFSIGMVSDAKAHDRPQPTARAPFHVYSFDGVDLSHSSIDGRVGSGGDIFLRNTGVGRKQYREEDTLLSGGRVTFQHGDVFHGGISANDSISIDHAAVFGDVNSGGAIRVQDADVLGHAKAQSSVRKIRASIRGIHEYKRYHHTISHINLHRHLEDYSFEVSLLRRNNTIQPTALREARLQVRPGLNIVEISGREAEYLRRLVIYPHHRGQVIINIQGKSVLNLSDLEVQVLQHYEDSPEQVLINFPNVQSLCLGNTHWEASILAPRADMRLLSGHLHGLIYTKSLRGSATITSPHNYQGPYFWQNRFSPERP